MRLPTCHGWRRTLHRKHRDMSVSSSTGPQPERRPNNTPEYTHTPGQIGPGPRASGISTVPDVTHTITPPRRLPACASVACAVSSSDQEQTRRSVARIPPLAPHGRRPGAQAIRSRFKMWLSSNQPDPVSSASGWLDSHRSHRDHTCQNRLALETQSDTCVPTDRM